MQALDTNFIIALTDPRPDYRQQALVKLDVSQEIVVPCICYGEAWHGLTLGHPEKTARKRKLWQDTILPLRVLWLNDETKNTFSDLCWQLSRQGTPIPTNDIWIAALCLQHDAELVTRDHDFKHVPDLRIRMEDVNS